MLKRNRINRDQIEMFSIEDCVPRDHLLRKIDAAVDFGHIYDFVEDLYCKDNGRPSVDPVVLIKIVLIQHLYGIPSLRRTCEEIQVNVAYRWFLGYLMNEPMPHFSTVSHNFKHRFTEYTIEQIFYWILNEINDMGYLSPETVFIDGTHIKANANMKKVIKKAVPEAVRIYDKQLMEEINEDRESHGKKPLKDNNDKDNTEPCKEKIVNESTTDPDSGVFHKGEHKKCMAYAAQTACDKHGYILDVTVNAGNIHDSVAFDGLYEKLKEFYEIRNVAADAAYKTPWITKRLIDDGIVPAMPYKRPMTKKGYFRKSEFEYDREADCVICPNKRILKYSTTNRDGYREYKSNPRECQGCPYREKCTNSKNCQKVVLIHIWHEYLEQVEEYRRTEEFKAIYEKRKETIERVFADAKEKHGMRYTLHRGLAQVTKWVRLKFAAMNLKKYAIHRWEHTDNGCIYTFWEYFKTILNPVLT